MASETIHGAKVRHELERRLLTRHEVGSQAELLERLRDAGHDVTQATISRDLAALGAHKVRTRDGRSIYALRNEAALPLPPRSVTDADVSDLTKLGRAFVIDSFRYQNMLTVHCPAGAASYVAASLDGMDYVELKGTIAGDDTILVITQDPVSAELVEQALLSAQ